MKEQFRPMLASAVNLATLAYPVLVSPKLDGIRCIVRDGLPMSRKLKIIPNKFIQAEFEKARTTINLEGLDGELIVGNENAEDVFQKSTSGVMFHGGEPDFVFHVFDYVDAHHVVPYEQRLSVLEDTVWPRFIDILDQHFIENEKDLLDMEQWALGCGFEGLMIRDPEGLYKFGRSTTKEGALLKLKRFVDDEAVVVGFKEKMHNGNKDERSELGYAKRSTRKAGLMSTRTLGAVIVRSKKWPDVFSIGTGFDDALRADIWKRKKHYLRQTIRFKHQARGAKDVPRFPVFTGFRDTRDL